MVLIVGSQLGATGFAAASGISVSTWSIVVGLLLVAVTALAVYRRIGSGRDGRAAAIRAYREAIEQATSVAAEQPTSRRPHPMTHASSPFKKRTRSPLSRR
jgi:hypothetical protein